MFKVIDLLKGSETLFGLETTKEVGEWILALREAKVNKMGLGYWVKAPGEDDAPLPGTTHAHPCRRACIAAPRACFCGCLCLTITLTHTCASAEPLLKRKLELDAGFEIFHHWLSMEQSGQQRAHANKPTREQFATLLKSAPPVVEFDAESVPDVTAQWMRERPDDDVPQLMGASQTRLLQLLLDPYYDEGFIQASCRLCFVFCVDCYGIVSYFLSVFIRPSVFSSQVFLTTYRLFLTASELFLLVVNRHQSSEDPSPERDRCAYVLAQWVGLHYFDFARDQMLAMCLLDFVSTFVDRESEAFASILSVISAMDNTDARFSKQWLKTAPKPMLPDIYHRHMFDFIDLHPIEVGTLRARARE